MPRKRTAPGKNARMTAARTPARSNGHGDLAAVKSEVEAAVPKAVEALENEELPNPPTVPADGVDPGLAAATWRQASQLIDAYQVAKERLDRRERRVASAEETVSSRELEFKRRAEELTTKRHDLEATDQELKQRTGQLDDRDRELLERQLELAGRERTAEADFLAAMREKLAKTAASADAEHQALTEERERARAALRAELEQQRAELAGERAQVTDERAQLRAGAAQLQAREEDLAEARELYQERITTAIAAATERWQLECTQLRQRHEDAREHATKLEAQLVEHARIERAFEHRKPSEVLAELESLAAENAELRQERDGSPREAAAQLAGMLTEQQRWREERTVLLAQNERLQRQLTGYQITAVELERLKLTKDSLEVTVSAYRSRVEEQRRELEAMFERRESASPFEECTKMDTRYAEPRADLVEKLPPLSDFITYLRGFIRQQHHLYYTERDLRCFVAGLASSQLCLLPGLSGIGKTQLPQVFAHAIGAGSQIVSVGADWRTPQDLVGYYNAFERRFYESAFTKALYQAQCPTFADQPFFVVLDEMNLSHPEQYFNDALSALEQRKPDGEPASLELMTAEVTPAPRWLRQGRLLPVPRSVWFVGTANHDETTVSFADKTYDRAHVLELPTRPEAFDAPAVEPLGAVSLRALRGAFRKAQERHGAAVTAVQAFLGEHLADRLARDFHVAWGSRLGRQLAAFVPVVIEGGGTIGEATDHVVATRILRKLAGRHEVQVGALERLHEDLRRIWPQLDSDSGPAASLRLLDNEIHQRGGV